MNVGRYLLKLLCLADIHRAKWGVVHSHGDVNMPTTRSYRWARNNLIARRDRAKIYRGKKSPRSMLNGNVL